MGVYLITSFAASYSKHSLMDKILEQSYLAVAILTAICVISSIIFYCKKKIRPALWISALPLILAIIVTAIIFAYA